MAGISQDVNDPRELLEFNLESVRRRIGDAARRRGRNPDEILLIAVTKTVGMADILHAADLGVENVGENRVHEAIEKRERVGDRVRWHMVGHLQRRKVKDAVRVFDYIHSVDSVTLAQEIDRRCSAVGKIMPVLFEVNVSGEKTKYGFSPGETIEKVHEASTLGHIRIEGLMTMAPFVEDAEEARPCFRRLAQLAESVARETVPNVTMKYLSMGMTNDFEVAIEEGATMVRVGTAIFGRN